MWERYPLGLPIYGDIVYVWKGQDVLNIKSSVRLPSIATNFERQRGRTCSLEKFYYAQYSVHKAVPLKRSDDYLIERVRFNVINRYQFLSDSN